MDIPLSDVAERLARGGAREDVMFGAFDGAGGALVGLAGLRRQNVPRSRHRGRALIDALSAHARKLEGVERLALGVESTNEAARALYHSLGFVACSIEQAYKLGGEYWDSEMMSLALEARI